jgi:hypothetical protein
MSFAFIAEATNRMIFGNADRRLVQSILFYLILNVANGLLVRFIFDELPPSINGGIASTVISLVLNLSGVVVFYPLCDTVISNKELMFQHWPLTIGSGLLFGVRRVLTTAVNGTLSVGANYMTGTLLSLGAVVFDHLVLQKPFSSRWQWLYVVLSVGGCLTFGAELVKAIDNVFWIGFGYGCANKPFVLLNMVWVQFYIPYGIPKGVPGPS